jgi:hypothetical protein
MFDTAKKLVTRLASAPSRLMRYFERSYEPSKYYMRGVGPKTRERQHEERLLQMQCSSGKLKQQM